MTDFRYTWTRTFPPRYRATPQYRQQLTAEVDLLCEDQVNRVIDTLDRVELRRLDAGEPLDMDWSGRIPTREWHGLGMPRVESTWLSPFERDYDVEVRR